MTTQELIDRLGQYGPEGGPADVLVSVNGEEAQPVRSVILDARGRGYRVVLTNTEGETYGR